jgi:hypothetical protein
MGMASRVEIERGGAKATRAAVGECEVELMTFLPGHRIPTFEFEQGYIAIVLDGVLAKTFAREVRQPAFAAVFVRHRLPGRGLPAAATGCRLDRMVRRGLRFEPGRGLC